MTKSAGNFGLGHIYWGNPSWKTLFFVQYGTFYFRWKFCFNRTRSLKVIWKNPALKVLEKLAQKYLRQRAIVNAVAGCWSGIVLKLHFVSIMLFTYVRENRGYENREYRNNFFLLDMIIDYRLLIQIVPGITLNMSSYSECILDASDQLRLRAFTVR